MTLLSLEQVSLRLKISEASIRNWQKHGYIKPVNKNMYLEKDVLDLESKLETGELSRLTNRANKSRSTNKFIPTEYVNNKESWDKLEEIVSFIYKYNIKPVQAIFLLAVNALQKSGEIEEDNLYKALEFNNPAYYKRNHVFNELKSWFSKISSGKIEESNKYCNFLLKVDLPKESDILGIIYQSIIHEGKKSVLGSYYTPSILVQSVSNSNTDINGKILDPCCGTGQFLIQLAKNVEDPTLLWGSDIDEIATRITKVNLFMLFSDIDFKPNIYCKNTLLDWNETNFELIATNPPWGARLSKNDLKLLKFEYPEIESKESFSFFILFAIKNLCKNGRFSFILPESVLYVKNHKDIRDVILNNVKITAIQSYGKLFKKVFSPVVKIDGEITLPKKEHKIKITLSDREYFIPQKRFYSNRNYNFDIFCDEEDQEIVDIIFSNPYKTLKDNSKWALGIVTGNNKKYIEDIKSSSNEPIYKGKDLLPLKLGYASSYIEFNPKNFQQCSPEGLFRAKEKLVYKFISNDLVFAYDDKQNLTLNSANILIPELEDIPVKIIGSLFNSSIYRFLFRKKINALKILRGDIEYLPIPDILKDKSYELLILIKKYLDNKIEFSEIDNYYYNIFGLNDKLIEKIENFLN